MSSGKMTIDIPSETYYIIFMDATYFSHRITSLRHFVASMPLCPGKFYGGKNKKGKI